MHMSLSSKDISLSAAKRENHYPPAGNRRGEAPAGPNNEVLPSHKMQTISHKMQTKIVKIYDMGVFPALLVTGFPAEPSCFSYDQAF